MGQLFERFPTARPFKPHALGNLAAAAGVGGRDQQEAAGRMGVSRSTLSRILAEARRTVATAVTLGLALRIEGGSVTRPRADCGHRPKATERIGAEENASGKKSEGS